MFFKFEPISIVWLVLVLAVHLTEQKITNNTKLVELSLRYKSEAILFCNDDDEIETNDIELDDDSRPVKFKKHWKEATFYKTSGFFDYNASDVDWANISFERIVPDDTKYIFDPEQNKLTITKLLRVDIESTYICNSTSTNQSIQFESEVLPFLYELDQELFVAKEDGELNIKCQALYGFEKNQSLVWTWLKNGQVLTPSIDDKFQIQHEKLNQSSTLTIRHASEENDEGDYACVAANQFSNATRNMKVRVKSHLAPLWPALGVVAELIVLALIIVLCDRSSKKR